MKSLFFSPLLPLLAPLSLTASTLAPPSFAVPPLQSETEAAAAILEKMQAKHGSAERIKAVKTRVIEGSWKFDTMDGGGSFTEYHGGLHEAYLDSDYSGVGDFRMGNAGAIVWEENPMAGVKVKTGFDAANSLRQHALKKHVDWRRLFKSAELLGEEELGGRKHHKIRMNAKPIIVDLSNPKVTIGSDEDPPCTWYVDAETLLLSRIDMRIMSPMGGPSDITQTYSDWRSVDGLMYAFKTTSSMGPVAWTNTVEKVEHNVDFPKDRFQLSEKVKGALTSKDKTGGKVTEEIVVEDQAERHVATITTTCKQSELGKQMAICLPEVMVYLNKIGAQTVGAPFTRYHSFNPSAVEMEAGMFVSEPIEAGGRVKASTLPACKAAVVWHVGPYERLGETYGRMQSWINESGYESAGAPWEIYWTDPGMEPDASKWRTQIFHPVKQKAK